MSQKIYTTVNSFNAGEVSPLISGAREDISKYKSACQILENAFPLVEGGAKKMPGTYFGGATALGGAGFTGSITGNVLTVDSVNYGVIQVGQTLVPAFQVNRPVITALGTGTGGTGTYIINEFLTVSIMGFVAESNGICRLVPFQFSTAQGAFLELSEKVIRIWVNGGLVTSFPERTLTLRPPTWPTTTCM